MISDVTALIFVIGGLQGLLLTFALFRLRKHHGSLKYLIWLIGLLSYDTLSNVFYWGELYKQVPHLLGITMFFPALYGPLFYLYVRQLLRPATSFRKWDVLLFSAPIVCYAINAHIFLLSKGEKIELIQTIQVGEMPVTFIIGTLLMLSSFGFVITAMVRMYSDRKRGIHTQWIDWVRIMSVFQVIIWVFVFINLFTPLTFNGAPYILVSLMIYVLGYKALFTEKSRSEPIFQAPELDHPEKEKYGDLRLEKETQGQIWAQLESLIKTERLYTNPQLRVADLADKSGLAAHLVSQVINDVRAQNFNELINQFRIEESKRLLRAEAKMSIQAVMEASGFQAKSTFNTLFKNAVGETPSAYRKSASDG